MEKHKVNWTKEATEDLEKIFYYISYNLKEPNTARNLYSKILNAVFSLKYFPGRNRDASYYGIHDKCSRRLRVEKYIILYDVDIYNKDVYITHIFHSNQNYLNLI